MVNHGLILGNRYEVLSRIGRGGMADVYKAMDKKLNRFVAIKVLKKEFGEDTRFVKRFRAEAQSAAGLSHPNIVNVYDVAEERGVNYIVMELVEGITLKDYIDKRGKLSAREAISISIQVAMGIDAAHKNHIIHRDIKPQNIMISKEGKVKVTDFGIARAASAHTVSSAQMGSVHYTSPEQARGGFSDARSDIYSLGVTMYEMITGKVPFDGDSTVTVAIKHLQEDVVAPSEYVKDIPYSYEQIILKCIQKSPESRYLNMDELISDLKMSLINPNGDFVKIDNPSIGETVIFTPQDQQSIREATGYDEDEYDDEYEDDNDYDSDDYDDDDEYDVDEYDDENEDEDEAYDEENGENNPKLQKVTKILIIVAAALIALIILFVVGKASGIFTFGPSSSTEKGQVEVPDVVGMDYDDAKEELNDLGLGIKEVESKASKKYDEGEIISQTPEGGEKVDKNTTIKVVVSSGKEGDTEIPDVVGMEQDDAESALEEAGFKVETEFAEESDAEAGTVTAQYPGSETKGNKGDTITITVSKGVKNKTVPDVTGMTKSDAKSTIKSAGFKVGDISYDYSQDYAKGEVISQTPDGGSTAKAKSTVSLVISKGDIPTSEQQWLCNTTISLKSAPSGTITVKLTQSGSTVTVESGAYSQGSSYAFTYYGTPGVSTGTVVITDDTTGATLASQKVKFTRVQ